MAKWDDSTGYYRPAERTAHPGPVAHQRAKKDRRTWCGGHVGREHQVEIVEDFRRHEPCAWWDVWHADWSVCPSVHTVIGQYWRCRHMKQCAVCGKIMQHYMAEECPQRPQGAPTRWDQVVRP